MGNVDANRANFVMFKYTQDGLVKKNTKSYLVDSIALVSNIGGGLGLALGFSMFSVLDKITVKVFDKIWAHFSNQTKTPDQHVIEI